ncbi:S1 family peptidase [Alteromonas macleodii]
MMAMLAPQNLDAVVAIGVENVNSKQWIGTGFLVGQKAERNPDITDIFLITNAHVFDSLSQVCIRFNDISAQRTLDIPLNLMINGNQKWSRHPTADVAAIYINNSYLIENNVKYRWFDLHNGPLARQDMVNCEICEGDLLYVLGFPMGVVTEIVNHVMVRSGMVSQIQSFLNNRSNDFVIDSMVFPGNSGGPVLMRPEANSIVNTKAHTACSLIGMVKSYIPYSDTAVSNQTGKARITFEENSGLTLVESVDSIIATVAIEINRALLEDELTKSEKNRVYIGN